jgi:dUTP pyrophosphatase
MKVKIKKLNAKAVLPKKVHSTDAGFDLVATSRTFDENGNIVYGTGIAMEIPEGYVGLVFPRSSICKQDILLSNAVGVIDSHYRGEIMAKFKPTSTIASEGKLLLQFKARRINEGLCYKVGDRIAQLIIMPIPEIEFEEAEELSETDRGTGGYGSTGK